MTTHPSTQSSASASEPPAAPHDAAKPHLHVDMALVPSAPTNDKFKVVAFSDAQQQRHITDTRWELSHWENVACRHYWFSMCRSGGGRFSRISDTQKLSGQLMPGMLEVCLPSTTGVVDAPRFRATILGAKPATFEAVWREMFPRVALSSLDGSRFYRNSLIEELIVATLEQAQDHAHSSLFFDHVLALLIHRLVSPRHAADAKLPGLSQRQTKLVVEFIEEHLSEDVALLDLGQLVGLSIGEFSRRFRVSMGCPPYAYLRQLRMKKAVSLMADPSLSVAEIGEQVGYANPSQFSRSFQRYSGLRPLIWRRENL